MAAQVKRRAFVNKVMEPILSQLIPVLPNHIFLRFILKSASHLRLGTPMSLQGFKTNILQATGSLSRNHFGIYKSREFTD
jgi:hypothetical protein